MLKVYTTQFICLAAIAMLIIQLYHIGDLNRNSIKAVIILAIGYLGFRYL